MEQEAPKIFSLSAVAQAIENALREPARKTFWVQAEVTSPRLVGGHLYATLVEQQHGATVAKMHCVVWESTRNQIMKSFKKSGLDFSLSQGMQACLLCRISFHAVYGLTLTVLDADPRFVLGELELRKRALIDTLVAEDADGLNRLNTVPALPLRLGLVTSREGDAYMDILRILSGSGFGFTVLLADAFMQGENAERSIIRAIDVLEQQRPDLIVIARGGGNRTDLAWLDTEALARRIAGSGFPIWTGIGHANDSGVLDLVAHSSFETPTAVAKAIIARFENAAIVVAHAVSRLQREWLYRLASQRMELEDDAVGIRQGTRKLTAQTRTSLIERSERFEIMVDGRLADARQRNRLGSQHLRMRCEQLVHAHLAQGPVLLQRTRTAARRTKSMTFERLQRNRARFDAGRVRATIDAHSVLVRGMRTTLQRSAIGATGRFRREYEHRRNGLLRGTWLVRLEGFAERLSDRLRLILAHDPRKALDRGYAIIQSTDDDIVTSVRQLAVNQFVRLSLRDGNAHSIIHSIEEHSAGKEHDI